MNSLSTPVNCSTAAELEHGLDELLNGSKIRVLDLAQRLEGWTTVDLVENVNFLVSALDINRVQIFQQLWLPSKARVFLLKRGLLVVNRSGH